MTEARDLADVPNGLTVNSSGYVLTSLRPAFNASRTSSQAVNNSTIVFDQVSLNVGNHYNNTTGQFTAPVAGVYQFSFECVGGASLGGHDYFAKVNGVTNQQLISVRPPSVNNTDTLASRTASTGLISLSASNTVEVFSPQNLTVYSDGNSWLKFSGYLIG